MRSNVNTLGLWQYFGSVPLGAWFFSRMVSFRAPFFSSIRPRFVALRPGYCQVRMSKRRAVLNHLGTVHAIAMCNMAELAGGTMTEVTVPSTHRWIPKGMQVDYLKKASTDLIATATPESGADGSLQGEFKVKVVVHDAADEAVFRAIITMWVSPKNPGR